MDIWKKIEQLPDFEINKIGVIRNIKTKEVVNQFLDKDGYPIVKLRLPGGYSHTSVHKLVALTFIKNECDKPQINHIDGNKLNNSVSNLEWVTAKENISHSYDTLLNSNTTHLLVLDHLTGKEKKFRSIKLLSKLIKVHLSTLMPLIQHSDRNPVLNRYTIKIVNEDLLLKRFNTINFGRPVFVYDHLNEQTTKYQSVLLASYYTSLRCLSNIGDGFHLKGLGFSISFDIDGLVKQFDIGVDDIYKNRERYYLTPYKPKIKGYVVYDYYLKKEFILDSAIDVMNFINNHLEPNVPMVSVVDVCAAVAKTFKNKYRTGLLRGFGLKKINDDDIWHPYGEYVIICNKYKRFTTMVYKTDDGLVFGADIHSRLVNNPFLKYTRLDKPIV